MYLMYYLNEKGERMYTLKVSLKGTNYDETQKKT